MAAFMSQPHHSHHPHPPSGPSHRPDQYKPLHHQQHQRLQQQARQSHSHSPNKRSISVNSINLHSNSSTVQRHYHHQQQLSQHSQHSQHSQRSQRSQHSQQQLLPPSQPQHSSYRCQQQQQPILFPHHCFSPLIPSPYYLPLHSLLFIPAAQPLSHSKSQHSHNTPFSSFTSPPNLDIRSVHPYLATVNASRGLAHPGAFGLLPKPSPYLQTERMTPSGDWRDESSTKREREREQREAPYLGRESSPSDASNASSTLPGSFNPASHHQTDHHPLPSGITMRVNKNKHGHGHAQPETQSYSEVNSSGMSGNPNKQVDISFQQRDAFQNTGTTENAKSTCNFHIGSDASLPIVDRAAATPSVNASKASYAHTLSTSHTEQTTSCDESSLIPSLPPRPARNCSRLLKNNINESPASRRHQTVDLNNSTPATAAGTAGADSSAFMYDDHSLLHSSPAVARRQQFLDEALADPNDHDEDLGGEEAEECREFVPDADISYHSAYSHIYTPDLDDIEDNDIHADFADFMARAKTASAKGKAEVRTHYNELINANSSVNQPLVSTHKSKLKAQSAKTSAAKDPNYQKFVNAMACIYNLTDEDLENRFTFEKEIGFGNWGSVWMCQLKSTTGVGSRLGRAAAMNGGFGAGGRVAIKLAHRSKEAANTQRVHALWHELKIIRGLRHDTHPSIIEFEAFVITPSYALIVMPYLSNLIELNIPVTTARPYFRALASAVAYLHEHGITHNDIKPANIVMNHNNVPVLVDFGFAQKHEIGSPGRFLSTARMGTPEYLDPQRVVGQPHDERASDVWSLGITFYEILIGRTPFEINEQEVFSEEDLPEYWHRTRAGQWLGEWDMPPKMEGLLRYMICPDPVHRISALQAYHHAALQPSKESVNPTTPHFVREAVREPENESQAAFDQVRARKLKNVKSDVGMVRKKKPAGSRNVTPLGESIKQHTSSHELRPTIKTGEVREREESVSKKKAKSTRSRVERKQPTHKVKQQRIAEIEKEQNKQMRVSDSEHLEVARPSSAAARLFTAAVTNPESPTMDHLDISSSGVSVTGFFQPSPAPPKSHQEAMQRTLRHLEGNAQLRAGQDKLEVVYHRQAPKQSLEVAHSREEAVLRTLQSLEGDKKTNGRSEDRRQVYHDLPSTENLIANMPLRACPSPSPFRPHSLDSATVLSRQPSKNDMRRSEGPAILLAESRPCTPPRHSRYGSTAPVLDVNISTGSIFPPSLRSRHDRAVPRGSSLHNSPLRGHAGRAHVQVAESPARGRKQSAGPTAIGPKDDNLDRLADWAKSIEKYVEVARKARAEGLPEPPMPLSLEEHFGTLSGRNMSPVAQVVQHVLQADFGGAQPVPMAVRQKRSSRRLDRPTVSQLFHRNSNLEKESKDKKPVLRRMAARIPTRKSEPQLNAAVVSAHHRVDTNTCDYDEKTEMLHTSWRNSQHMQHTTSPVSPPVEYSLLAPPAIDGLTPTGPAFGTRILNKPSSMISLREKARAFLGDKDKDRPVHKASQTLPRSTKSADLLYQSEKHPSHLNEKMHHSRPQTPGGHSVFGIKERKGLFKLFKRS